MKQEYTYRCAIERVVDGDTVDAIVDLGFTVQVNVRFRLHGIDTPERGQDGFHEATSYLQFLLDPCKEIFVESSKTGKFGRWLGRFYVQQKDSYLDVNAEMIKKGHAVEYGK